MPPADPAARRGPSRKAPIALLVVTGALLIARVTLGIIEPPPPPSPFHPSPSGSIRIGP